MAASTITGSKYMKSNVGIWHSSKLSVVTPFPKYTLSHVGREPTAMWKLPNVEYGYPGIDFQTVKYPNNNY